jgi:hypothetical protein
LTRRSREGRRDQRQANNTFDRTAGSHSLAATGQRER